MQRTRYLIPILLLALGLAVVSAAPATAHSTVSVSLFYDSLAPYGDWLVSAEFGYVWHPRAVGYGWRPYSDGQWIYSDYGWTFVSDVPWGWAAFHYGRWTLDPYYGWVWVPGTEWAPAWVVFQAGDGYVGWAPLPPGISLSVALSGRLRIDPTAYCFVREREFLTGNVRRSIVAPRYNLRLVGATRNVTRFERNGRRYVNRSLSVERIERSTQRRVERRRIVDVAPGRGRVSEIRGKRVSFYRPHVDRRETHPPAVRHDRSAEARSSHGRNGAAANSQHGKSKAKKHGGPPPHP